MKKNMTGNGARESEKPASQARMGKIRTVEEKEEEEDEEGNTRESNPVR